MCHYCDYEVPAPTACPACNFAGIRYWGLGTQRLEAEVRARFPNVMALRMDTDTMQAHGSHERALSAFRAGKVRILLGTQMIAKGLDFPNVTLVGVINADTALHLPDFRAAERTFHLVTQVAGRTGRGPKGGRVLVQTFSPDHPAIQAAVRHDYAAFAAGELPIRQMLRYPPFASMIRLVVRGPVEAVAAEFADYIAQRLAAALTQRRHTAVCRQSYCRRRRPTVDASATATARLGSLPADVADSRAGPVPLRAAEGAIPFSDSGPRSRRRAASGGRASGHGRAGAAGRRAVDCGRGSGGDAVEE